MKKAKTLSLVGVLSLATAIPNAYALQDGETFKEWTGKCETIESKKFCGITQTIKNDEGKPLVNIFIRKIDGQPGPLLFVKVPLGVQLTAGLGIAVDKTEIIQVPYTTCDPAGCNAVVPLDSAKLAQIKSGSKMQVGMLYKDKEIVMTASLSGVTKALAAL